MRGVKSGGGLLVVVVGCIASSGSGLSLFLERKSVRFVSSPLE